ncbi:FAD-dependent oxidoreductase [Endozoicomonas sp. SCSIO W0465]|uniref:FAD-dependent oxidoreductase n=1 Tax=Endozoicomonas sp. SCSIO W0465 TaxID=2918516 RepID=UPI0020762253|nr:FAD-dependent oxidoreductase [Endozoicomonas sp. SCSIO W0465]USE37394.1 FAD-dependent oxidoreductase [Endozoicomonas sp. SCSIO W0465]
MSKQRKKIAISGFGLTGRLATLALYHDHQLDIYETGNISGEQSAGFVAAAMLAPLAESVLCEQDLAQMGLEAIAMWQRILERLDHPVFFQQAGSLVIAHQQDRGDLVSFRHRLKALNGIKPEIVDSRIADLEPELADRFHQGIFLPCEGQLDNRAFYIASYEQVKDKVRFLEKSADSVCMQAYDYVIDCRGLGAKRDLCGLRGVRGEVVRLYAPEVTLHRPIRLMHPRYPIYIAPKPNHEFVIGATEIESQSNKPITLRSAMELLSSAYTVHRGFAEAEIVDMRAGLRPSLPDNRPLVETKGNHIMINGLYRHGYLLAPKVVDIALSHIN